VRLQKWFSKDCFAKDAAVISMAKLQDFREAAMTANKNSPRQRAINKSNIALILS